MHLLLYEQRSMLGRICLQLDCSISISAYILQEYSGAHTQTHTHTHLVVHAKIYMFSPNSLMPEAKMFEF